MSRNLRQGSLEETRMNTSHMQLHLVLLNTEKGATVMSMVIFVARCSPGVMQTVLQPWSLLLLLASLN